MRFALAALVLFAQATGSGRAMLDGHVVVLGTEMAVRGATVVLAPVSGSLADYRVETTDPSGRFAFSDLPRGSYRVHVERQGYLRGEYGRRTATGTGVPVVVAASEPRVSIVVPLIRTGVIAGRVLDEGRPVRHALVRALRTEYRDGERMVRMADYARTDDLGQYRLFDLAPGSYLVAGAPQPAPRIEGDTYVLPVVPSNANNNRSEIRTPLAEAIAKGSVEASAFRPGAFLPVFYPGTLQEAAAWPVELRSGDMVTGIDLPVVRVPTARVRGRVLTATGEAAEGVQVSVRSGGSQAAAIPGAQVRDGSFELASVPPGMYELAARTATQYGTVSVQVGDQDLDGIEIRLRPGTMVMGRVVVEDPPPGFPERDARVLRVQLVSRVQPSGSARVDGNGTFAIQNVQAGEYRLRLLYRGEVPPRSARFGTEDVTVAPLRIAPETEGLPLDIVVSLSTGALDVSVVDARGRPRAGTVVALVPDAPRRDRSGLYRTATADLAGRAHLDEVPPGEYTVFAGDVDPVDWHNPDVLAAFDGRGERVRIRADARGTVTLEVAP